VIRRLAGRHGPRYNPDVGFLSARDEAEVRREFQKIGGPVRLVVFASELGGETNSQTVALAREVAALSDRLSVEVLNPYIDRDRAQGYGISLTPAVVVEGAQDYGIRFLGIPAGYEFANLVDAVIVASTGEPGLAPATRETLAGLGEDVTIKVFATPT
jgi:alkyl hydroperoxide reductase subunit AhpF